MSVSTLTRAPRRLAQARQAAAMCVGCGRHRATRTVKRAARSFRVCDSCAPTTAPRR